MRHGSPVIAIVGAGSFSHGRKVLDDLFTVDALQRSEIRLVAPHIDHLGVVHRYGQRMIGRNGLQINLLATTDRLEALRGADYVIGLYDAGGFPAFDADYSIVRGYGVDICIGDSSGPTGIMNALRNASILRDLAADINRLCPRALYLNYTNPMAVMMMSAEAFGIERAVGLCGGAEATRRTIGNCLACDPEELEIEFAGINHMCWVLSVTHRGRNVYDEFRRRLAEPAYLTSERVRFEVLQQFGYFVTESSGHLSDFFPWFRRSPELRRRYCSVEGYSGASGAFHKFAQFVYRQIGTSDYLEYEDAVIPTRSDEYGAGIIEAVETGRPYRFVGNIMNRRGKIPNLPADCCVEIPLVADGNGLRAERSIPLPPQLAALCRTNILSQQLTLQAIVTGDPELAYAAAAVDPLTSSTVDLPTLRDMMRELLDANRRYLPGMAGAALRRTIAVKNSYSAKPVLDQQDSLLGVIHRYRTRKRLRKGSDPGPNHAGQPRT